MSGRDAVVPLAGSSPGPLGGRPWTQARVPDEVPRLQGGALHVWALRLDTVEDQHLDAAATMNERDHAARFHHEDDRRRFLAGRVLVRSLLASYTNVAAKDVGIGRDCRFCGDPRHGKPFLKKPAGTGIGFNLSHSGAWVLMGVVRDAEVGADVERIDRTVDVDAFGRDVLAGPAAARMALAPPAGRRWWFYECWTQQEALLKLSGLGLAGLDRPAGIVGQTWEWPIILDEDHLAHVAIDAARTPVPLLAGL